MRIVLEKEAYAKLQKQAEVEDMTTRELSVRIINAWVKRN